MNSIVRKLFEDAAAKIRDRILNSKQSFHQIANESGVSLFFVNKVARQLREETGFSRRPKKVA